MKGLSAVADERCQADKLDGVIKHWSSRETTMVGRGPLSTAVFLGGTDGSNPVPSRGESANHRFLSGGARFPQRARRAGARLGGDAGSRCWSWRHIEKGGKHRMCRAAREHYRTEYGDLNATVGSMIWAGAASVVVW